jgi:hypothetical protein
MPGPLGVRCDWNLTAQHGFSVLLAVKCSPAGGRYKLPTARIEGAACATLTYVNNSGIRSQRRERNDMRNVMLEDREFQGEVERAVAASQPDPRRTLERGCVAVCIAWPSAAASAAPSIGFSQ